MVAIILVVAVVAIVLVARSSNKEHLSSAAILNGGYELWSSRSDEEGSWFEEGTEVTVHIALKAEELNVYYGLWDREAQEALAWSQFDGSDASTDTYTVPQDGYYQIIVADMAAGHIDVTRKSYIAW